MHCRCSKAYSHSSIVWVSPWQMVGLHFYHWSSGFQVYCIPLQVKEDCSLHSAVKVIEKNAITSVQKYVYNYTLSWYCLKIYLVHYVFRINDKNVNPKVSKAGHKSLALPLKCLGGFQSLIQEADSHFHYEETANKRYQRSCMFNSLQHLQKSQSKMPRFFWSFCLQMLNITDLTESGILKPAIRNPINAV